MVLIDYSPYKSCMNCPLNCIFPEAYTSFFDNNFLNDVLWPYLEQMKEVPDIESYVKSHFIGQEAVTTSHLYYNMLREVIEVPWDSWKSKKSTKEQKLHPVGGMAHKSRLHYTRSWN
ncbi:hypothetical protein O6H91_21G051700 [Diphasiastrum complanatum]|uniref:Uncharacterized protein n=1 Tax=Diphasiastrum complanatum TaxID=34168 RepID=A0ACC2ALM2_DIPCM|nr:hypothetical protein O6H91_21G051700 [Diphasiastrum complanatum]